MSRSVLLGSLSRCISALRQRNTALRISRQHLRPVSVSAARRHSANSNNEHNSLQGHQEHEFSPSRAREILSAQVICETTNFDVEEELAKETEENYVCEEGEPIDRPYDARGSVSLYSVMQTNVPEPYKGSKMGNPTHMNMPGGGFMRDEKYIADRHIQSAHPKVHSRSYATSAVPDDSDRGRMQGVQETYVDVFSPHRPTAQGIQGDECVSFRLWLQNCAFYGLDCETQAEEFIAGRRSLKDIFAEQERQIDEVVARGSSQHTEASQTDLQGVQGDDIMKMIDQCGEPCPQGLQGESCEQFKMWLQNCRKYGTGIECERAFRQYVSGHKTLQELFQEQENVINQIQKRPYSTSSGQGESSVQNVSQKDRLKKAFKEYGATVVVFHVCISLASLGGFYMAVSSGLDMVALLQKLGVGESILSSRVTAGASTFVIAYAVHKVFAPARIACTLTCTPFLVRYLRKVGVLKKPIPKK